VTRGRVNTARPPTCKTACPATICQRNFCYSGG